MKNVVLFASGAGSNAENIILNFRQNALAKVVAVFCNNAAAGVVSKSVELGIPVEIFSKKQLNDGEVLNKLKSVSPDLIVLAGFLLKFPIEIIQEFPGRIINIHPALLPKYGGHGMYGMNVHRAVIDSRESESGITIHYIDEHYDEGDIIFQKSVSLDENETAESVAEKVRLLELEYFPRIIENILTESN